MRAHQTITGLVLFLDLKEADNGSRTSSEVAVSGIVADEFAGRRCGCTGSDERSKSAARRPVPTCRKATKQRTGSRRMSWQGCLPIAGQSRVEEDRRPNRHRTSSEVAIDFESELRNLAVTQLTDMASFQVMRYDPRTGRAQKYSNYAYRRSSFDRPFRWYDAAIPYQFPEFGNTVSKTNGKVVR